MIATDASISSITPEPSSISNVSVLKLTSPTVPGLGVAVGAGGTVPVGGAVGAMVGVDGGAVGIVVAVTVGTGVGVGIGCVSVTTAKVDAPAALIVTSVLLPCCVNVAFGLLMTPLDSWITAGFVSVPVLDNVNEIVVAPMLVIPG